MAFVADFTSGRPIHILASDDATAIAVVEIDGEPHIFVGTNTGVLKVYSVNDKIQQLNWTQLTENRPIQKICSAHLQGYDPVIWTLLETATGDVCLHSSDCRTLQSLHGIDTSISRERCQLISAGDRCVLVPEKPPHRLILTPSVAKLDDAAQGQNLTLTTKGNNTPISSKVTTLASTTDGSMFTIGTECGILFILQKYSDPKPSGTPHVEEKFEKYFGYLARCE